MRPFNEEPVWGRIRLYYCDHNGFPCFPRFFIFSTIAITMVSHVFLVFLLFLQCNIPKKSTKLPKYCFHNILYNIISLINFQTDSLGDDVLRNLGTTFLLKTPLEAPTSVMIAEAMRISMGLSAPAVVRLPPALSPPPLEIY